MRLDVIVEGAQALGSAKSHLVIDLLPLNLSTVSHPLAKSSWVCSRHLKNLWVLGRLGRVGADTPAAADSLVFVAEEIAVQ